MIVDGTTYGGRVVEGEDDFLNPTNELLYVFLLCGLVANLQMTTAQPAQCPSGVSSLAEPLKFSMRVVFSAVIVVFGAFLLRCW